LLDDPSKSALGDFCWAAIHRLVKGKNPINGWSLMSMKAKALSDKYTENVGPVKEHSRYDHWNQPCQ